MAGSVTFVHRTTMASLMRDAPVSLLSPSQRLLLSVYLIEYQEHYRWTISFLAECECDPEGSYSLQCEERTGQCLCKDSVEGRKCDRCVENKYNITAGCIDCPPCYRLVQEHITVLRSKVNELRVIIENIGENPQAINDTDFRMKMAAVNESVVNLWEDAKLAGGQHQPSA